MPRKCGCEEGSGRCWCEVEDTESVQWSGDGSPESPFQPTLAFPLQVEDTSSLNLDLSQTEGGFNLSAIAGAGGSHASVFTEDGTWNDPGGLTVLRIILVGGGGGGGGEDISFVPLDPYWRYGGHGGGGGAVTDLLITTVPASVPVVIGQGGARGQGDQDGFDGGDTTFGDYRASGGIGGPKGFAGSMNYAPIQGSGDVYGGQFGTAKGGGSVIPGNPYIEGIVGRLAPGGGGFGQILGYPGGSYPGPPVTVAHPGTSGGYSWPAAGSRLQGPASAFRSTPSSPNGPDSLAYPVGAGGFGGYSTSVNGAGNGAHGGLYGGGGGGAGVHTSNPRAGGNGAPGICIVMGW